MFTSFPEWTGTWMTPGEGCGWSSRNAEIGGRHRFPQFASLQTDFNERDNPVLIGVRASGDKVPVAGMSDGTRDQLFLSLRLAALEKHLANDEPLPLIADDLLVNFGDQRSEATAVPKTIQERAWTSPVWYRPEN